jgi:hypothetical protein
MLQRPLKEMLVAVIVPDFVVNFTSSCYFQLIAFALNRRFVPDFVFVEQLMNSILKKLLFSTSAIIQ